ncbi:MAG: nitric oxide synthase [Acidobacteriota bacterium]
MQPELGTPGEVKLTDVNDVKSEVDFKGYDAYLFGSATYHGEMMPSMKQMLFIAERARLSGKAGGAFGSYGWSGEAPQKIYDTMKNLYRMNMINGVLRVQVPVRPELLEKVSYEYGSKLMDKINSGAGSVQMN